jgi:hypothetical protein
LFILLNVSLVELDRLFCPLRKLLPGRCSTCARVGRGMRAARRAETSGRRTRLLNVRVLGLDLDRLPQQVVGRLLLGLLVQEADAVGSLGPARAPHERRERRARSRAGAR